MDNLKINNKSDLKQAIKQVNYLFNHKTSLKTKNKDYLLCCLLNIKYLKEYIKANVKNNYYKNTIKMINELIKFIKSLDLKQASL